MAESPLMMLLHAFVIGIVLFLVMYYALKQNYDVALTRTIFASLLVALYMIVFGHGLPNKINSNLITASLNFIWTPVKSITGSGTI